MPTVTEQVTTTQEVATVVAHDADGKELRSGDRVTLTMIVGGIEEVLDGETGKHDHDLVSLAVVKPSGYNQHMMRLDSRLLKKAGQ